ncbi:hypothetical protein BIW11_09216 [Tropilaelaps mercedesae]|uniref:Uncharacterized protein n=1 Tax=Tropilaelaps mercedesae TaxID=418985 RepID=A0A1V9XL55_9ACAR|nr:hypothetical protein BIW11_09216 [Tropilaelaps mercedesae]
MSAFGYFSTGSTISYEWNYLVVTRKPIFREENCLITNFHGLLSIIFVASFSGNACASTTSKTNSTLVHQKSCHRCSSKHDGNSETARKSTDRTFNGYSS